MIMYELLSGNRGDLIPLNFPGEGESNSVQTQGFFLLRNCMEHYFAELLTVP